MIYFYSEPLVDELENKEIIANTSSALDTEREYREIFKDL